jgi:hypothetical protein
MDIVTLLVLAVAVGIAVWFAVKHYQEGQAGKGDPSNCDCPPKDEKGEQKDGPSDGSK